MKTLPYTFSVKPHRRRFYTRVPALVRKGMYTMLATVVSVTSIAGIFEPAQSLAWSSSPLPKCTTVHPSWSFTSWDWKSAVQGNINWRNNFSSTDTVDTVLSNGSTKSGVTYSGPAAEIIFQDSGANAGPSSNLVIVQFTKAQGSSFYWHNSTDYGFTTTNYNPGSGAMTFVLDMNAHTVSSALSSIYSTTYGTASGASVDPTCIEQSYNYLEGQFGSSSGLYTAVPPGSTRDCSGLLVVACTVEDAFAGIGNDFVSVGKAILGGLADLFIPNGSQLSSDWSSFYSTLSGKLGFLLWPFTFVGGLFTAMVTPTTSCCTVPGGTLFGATIPGINLAYVETNVPFIWTSVTTVVKGATVLMLFFFLREKFMEITQK